jgi:DNA-binding transcriptional MocR family regulator
MSTDEKTQKTKSEQILFTRGVPPAEALPADDLGECFDSVVRNDTSVVLQYGQQRGYAPLRRQLAEEYGVSEDQVLVGNGSLQLQDLLSKHLIREGDAVFTEQPSYDRSILTFRRNGARVTGIPLEEDGIDVDRLEAALQREVPAFLYLVPDFQNPTGATLSLEKRRKVVELAERYGFHILEDIPYRKLRYRGEDLPLMRDLDSADRVITVSSFSKLLSPGMRVGFMIGAKELIDELTRLGENTYLAPVLPTQAAVSEYMRRGMLEPNIESLKELYEPRWEAMTSSVKRGLPGATMFTSNGGFFVGMMLPEDANTNNLVGRAKEQGLVLTPGESFFADSEDGEPLHGERFVRLPFCAVTTDQIEEGVDRLARLV